MVETQYWYDAGYCLSRLEESFLVRSMVWMLSSWLRINVDQNPKHEVLVYDFVVDWQRSMSNEEKSVPDVPQHHHLHLHRRPLRQFLHSMLIRDDSLLYVTTNVAAAVVVFENGLVEYCFVLLTILIDDVENDNVN